MSNQDVIKATAKVDMDHAYHGNDCKLHTGMNYYDYRNGKMFLNSEVVEINRQSCMSPLVYKFALRLDEKPVSWDDIKALDPMLRTTKGLVMIKYTPKHSKDYRKGRPFKIGQDLIRWDIRVSGKKEWHELCDRIPELNRLRNNSTLSDKMFDLAVMHPGMTFWCNVDWVKYYNKLQAQTQEKLDRPFVSRKVSVQEYKDIYKKGDKAIMLRTLNHIIKEVQAVETLPAVQREMKKATGEVAVTNPQNLKGAPVMCERDPKTGRFTKRRDDLDEILAKNK